MSSRKLPWWTEFWQKIWDKLYNSVQIYILVVKMADKINYALQKAKSPGTTSVCTNA